MQQPFFVDHSVIPTHQIGQGEGLIRAVGVCGAVGGGGGLFHSPHDLADGGAVLGQVGLAAARVGEQDLAQMAHHQRQRQQLGGFGVVVVTGISGGLVDLLSRKAPGMSANPTITGNLLIHTFHCRLKSHSWKRFWDYDTFVV